MAERNPQAHDAAARGQKPAEQPGRQLPENAKLPPDVEEERRTQASVGDPSELGPQDTFAQNAGADEDGLIAVVTNQFTHHVDGTTDPQVGIWERHPMQPLGEVMVLDRPMLVAPTPAVNEALAARRLRRVERSEAESVAERAERERTTREQAQAAIVEREQMTLARMVRGGVEQQRRDAERERELTGRDVRPPEG